MDVGQARKIAKSLLPKQGETLKPGDVRIDAGAFTAADDDKDGVVSREELVVALTQDRVRLSPDRKQVITPIELVEKRPKAPSSKQEAGLVKPPPFRSVLIPGGDPQNPPSPVTVVRGDQEPGEGQTAGTLSQAAIDGLKGASYEKSTKVIKTLEDVALGLSQSIGYEEKRAGGGGGGPLGPRSASETGDLGTGVCRDQMEWARQHLMRLGYKAVLVEYDGPDQLHLVTAYQDKDTGKWGILEYGQLYPPSALKANSPAEALMQVRPTAWTMHIYASENGPKERPWITHMVHTPAYFEMQRLMLGPAPGSGTGFDFSTRGFSAFAETGDWQFAAQTVTDPNLPYLRGTTQLGAWYNVPNAGVRIGGGLGYINTASHVVGSNALDERDIGLGNVFLSVEEFHRAQWSLLGGRADFSLQSHTLGHGVLAVGEKGYDFDADDNIVMDPKGIEVDKGTSRGLSGVNWEPSLELGVPLALWGDAKDSRAYARYGWNLDAMLLAMHWGTGGTSFPIDQYVQTGVTTRPYDWLGIETGVFVPISSHTNRYSSKVAANLRLNLPYVTVGTTQGIDLARYDVAVGRDVGPNWRFEAYGSIDEDRVSDEIIGSAGFQLRYKPGSKKDD